MAETNSPAPAESNEVATPACYFPEPAQQARCYIFNNMVENFGGDAEHLVRSMEIVYKWLDTGTVPRAKHASKASLSAIVGGKQEDAT